MNYDDPGLPEEERVRRLTVALELMDADAEVRLRRLRSSEREYESAYLKTVASLSGGGIGVSVALLGSLSQTLGLLPLMGVAWCSWSVSLALLLVHYQQGLTVLSDSIQTLEPQMIESRWRRQGMEPPEHIASRTDSKKNNAAVRWADLSGKWAGILSVIGIVATLGVTFVGLVP